MSIKIKSINHLGLAPKDPEASSSFFSAILGLNDLGHEIVEDQKVNTHMFSSGVSPDGPRLEVLKATSEESPIQKFIDKKGGGIHHIAFEVENLEESLTFLKEKGVQLIDEKPRLGADNCKIAFVHPKAAGGLLIELLERAE